MPVSRHQNARTTPTIRQALRESPLSIAELARRYHLSKAVYNHHLPRRVLGHVRPVQARVQWRLKQPELFVSEINHSLCPDT